MPDLIETPLFDLPDGAIVEPVVEPTLSADRRRTLRQMALLMRRRHPIGEAKLHPDAPPADDRDAPGPRCGSCRFRELFDYHNRTWPKCTKNDGIWVAHSASSDVRAWWPACVEYSAGDPRLSPDAARCVPEVA